MWQVFRFDQFPEQGITVGLFTTKADAESEARRLAAQFQHHDFDRDQGYWWGRNNRENAVRFVVQAK